MSPRVALVHDWLPGMRGGEKCLEASELFPDATIFTLLHRPGHLSPTIERMAIRTSWIQRIPGRERIYRHLHLKRLLVGNLERVYEFGRDFRNEGVSFKHNPEFTQLEFYWAYADYLQVMELTEQMVSTACKDVTDSFKVVYQGHELDFTPPWKRLEMRQGLLDVTGVDIYEYRDADSLAAALREKGFNPPVNATRGKLMDYMLSEYLEPALIQPVFLYDYPRDISPLAKSKPDDSQTVERFE